MTACTIDDNHIRYDTVCKQLLSDKHILAWIIKDCVRECQEMTIKEIIRCIEGDPEISKRAVFPEEMTTYDLLFTMTVPSKTKPIPLIIDIEAHSKFDSALVKHAAYYCAQMLSSQAGREFTGTNYGDLKKVYSIFICTDPPQYRMNSVYGYITMPTTDKDLEPLEGYDAQGIAFILLGNEEDEKAPSALRLLNVLLTSEKGAEERKRILKEEFEIPMTAQLESEVNEMSDLWRGVENRGIRKGRAEELLHAIKSLMKNLSFTMEQAMDALDVPKSEQERYVRLLKQ